MAGLNNIREAYQQVYAQLDERMDPEERALRRAEVADKKASRMNPEVAAKYAGSEARSAEREDKKSKGKHIHGMADSVELDGDLVDEGKVELKPRNKGEMQRKAGNLGREVVSTPNTKKNAPKRDAAMNRMKKLVSAIARDDEEKRFKTIGQSPLHQEEFEMEEGLDMKTFKSNRAKAQKAATRTDSERRSLVGKEWHNTGRKYTPDEAKSRRANMSDDDRAARHRAAVDPDDDRDENTYSADRTKNPKKQRKQAAMGETTPTNKKEGYAYDNQEEVSKESNQSIAETETNFLTFGQFTEQAANPAQQAAIAIAKKKGMKEAKYYDPMKDPDFDPHEAEKNRGVSGKNNPKGGKKPKGMREAVEELDEAGKRCWPGYKKKGTQKIFGKTYNRCVKEEEVENLDELNRYEKETGKDLKTGKPVTKGGTLGGDDTHSKVMRHMHSVMGPGRMGAGGAIQSRGKKKDRGGPTPGPTKTPAQKVAQRRAEVARSKAMQSSRYD